VRRAAAREGAREVGVDGGALAEDDPPDDAAFWLRNQTAQRLGERFAQPVERARVPQIESGQGAEERRRGGDPRYERRGAPAEPARAVRARGRQERERPRQNHG